MEKRKLRAIQTALRKMGLDDSYNEIHYARFVEHYEAALARDDSPLVPFCSG